RALRRGEPRERSRSRILPPRRRRSPAAGSRSAPYRAYARSRSADRRSPRGSRSRRCSFFDRRSEIVLARKLRLENIGRARDETQRKLEFLEVKRIEERRMADDIGLTPEGEHPEAEVHVSLKSVHGIEALKRANGGVELDEIAIEELKA